MTVDIVFCCTNPKFKSPASQAGLEQLPVGTLFAKHAYCNTAVKASLQLLKSSGRAEDDGVEP
jgi:hypothetical protein